MAFGGRSATYVECPILMANQLKSLVPGLKDYESLVPASQFLSQTALVNINGLVVAATASTPTQYKSNCNDKALFIPLAGEGVASTASAKFRYKAGDAAALLSHDEFTGVNSTRSVLIVKFDEEKLLRTTRNILGIDADIALNFDLTASREVSLKMGNMSFEHIFRQYGNLINQYYLHPALLNKTGLDDGIYSAMAMMLHPALFKNTAHLLSSENYDKKSLDRTCQYIQANLTSPISLTMLDQISGMSRRKLHYAFQHRFGCAPMHWVRQERLELANQCLLHAQYGDTVTFIAFKCGFTKMSSFARTYKLRFGELPSSTLAKNAL